MKVIDEPTRQRHTVADVEEDHRIVITACKMRIAVVGSNHDTPEHLVALPNCTCQDKVTNCCG